MRGVEWFIARRYLVSRERTLLASMIMIIAMLGVGAGVAALIVVTSVMDGADEQLIGRVIALYPHIRMKVETKDAMAHFDEALKILRAEPGVESVIPKLEKRTLIQHGSGSNAVSQGIQLIALDEITKDNPYGITLTDADVYKLRNDEVVLGWPLALRLGAMPVSRALLYSNNPITTAQGYAVKQKQLNVVHLFSSRLYDYDSYTAFVNTATMRDLFRMPDGFDYVHVKLKDPFAADRVMASLEKKLPPGFSMTTWSGENKQFFGALRLEKIGLFVILLLAIIVAGFNIACTMILIVNDKTREIGILKAIGATRRQIARVFLFNGVMIGTIGTMSGLALGLAACWAIVAIKWEMPQAIYQFSHMPVKVRPITIFAVLAASFAMTVTAAIIPARRAARLHPVEALRHD